MKNEKCKKKRHFASYKGRVSDTFFLILLFSFFINLSSSCCAEEFFCEVMAVEGPVVLTRGEESGRSVSEGDVLQVDDIIEVGGGAFVDIAYDSDWNNVTRIEENSKIRIQALYPTTIMLDAGGVFAKLKQLPKQSTFDVRTPTAIASVRGTEYRTTYVNGETGVYNVSDSDVSVYGVDDTGKKNAAPPVILRNAQKTEVPMRGVSPNQPRRMEGMDFKPTQHARERIEGKIQQNIEHGRVGRIQGVRQIESGEWSAKPHDNNIAQGAMRPKQENRRELGDNIHQGRRPDGWNGQGPHGQEQRANRQPAQKARPQQKPKSGPNH